MVILVGFSMTCFNPEPVRSDFVTCFSANLSPYFSYMVPAAAQGRHLEMSTADCPEGLSVCTTLLQGILVSFPLGGSTAPLLFYSFSLAPAMPACAFSFWCAPISLPPWPWYLTESSVDSE